MISIVIPAYNEEKRIGICLRSLLHQDYHGEIEVIVVNNCSTDATADKAMKLAPLLPVRIVCEHKKGRGAARRKGFEVARGDIILSTDADVIAPSDWISSMVQALHEEGTVAATGLARINDCAPWQNAIFNTVFPYLVHTNKYRYGHVGLSGFSFGVWKEVYERVGGFDSEADAYEDLELAMRLHPYGKIQLVTAAPVIFSGRRFQKGLLRGTSEYVKTYMEKFFAGKRRVELSNVQ